MRKEYSRLFYLFLKSPLGWGILLTTFLTSLFETVGLGMLVPFLSVILNGASPDSILGKIVSYIASAFPSLPLVAVPLLILVLLQVLKTIATLAHSYFTAYFVWHYNEKWSQAIMHNFVFSPLSFMHTHKQGELINNLLQEPTNGSQALLRFIQVFGHMLLALTLSFAILTMNWKITVTLTLFGISISIFGSLLLRRQSVRLGQEKMKSLQLMTAGLTETISNILLVKSHSLEQEREKLFTEENHRLTLNRVKSTMIQMIPDQIVEMMLILVICLILYALTGFEIDKLKQTLPELAVFIVMSHKLFLKSTLSLSMITQINLNLPSLKLINSLADNAFPKEELMSGAEFKQLDSDIIFENVTFGYDIKKPILENFNLTILQKKNTALIGPSGLGKSTIAILLMRFYNPISGKIKLNQNELQNFSIESIRRKIGYVSQETFILNGTILENIKLGLPEATEEEVIASCKLAAIHEYIASLKDGYQTHLQDRGSNLSGGQKQRIGIARAILKDPEIYILDEATSSLDATTEEQINQTILTALRGKTIINISHKGSIIDRADAVYNLAEIIKKNK